MSFDLRRQAFYDHMNTEGYYICTFPSDIPPVIWGILITFTMHNIGVDNSLIDTMTC